MTIEEFLEKWRNHYEVQSSNLKNEINSKGYELSEINNELNFLYTKRKKFRNRFYILVSIFAVLALLSSIVGFFNIIQIQLNQLLIALVGIGLTGYSGFTFLDNKLKKEEENKRFVLENKRNSISKEIEINNVKIFENDEKYKIVAAAENFLKKNNCKEFMKKELPIKEETILKYIKNNFSLLGILYLANNKILNDASLSNISSMQILELKKRLYDVETKLMNNPELISSEKKINLNDNVKQVDNQPLLFISESGINEIDINKESDYIRHRRSDKYLENKESIRRRKW